MNKDLKVEQNAWMWAIVPSNINETEVADTSGHASSAFTNLSGRGNSFFADIHVIYACW